MGGDAIDYSRINEENRLSAISSLGKHPNRDNLLFSPIDLQLARGSGNQPAITISHRIALAPLTRYRGTKKGHVPRTELMTEYYAQRACEPGTFLITEASIISPSAGGHDHSPGIWREDQIEAWKEVRIHIPFGLFGHVASAATCIEPRVFVC
jgi:hypothetical protein